MFDDLNPKNIDVIAPEKTKSHEETMGEIKSERKKVLAKIIEEKRDKALELFNQMDNWLTKFEKTREQEFVIGNKRYHTTIIDKDESEGRRVVAEIDFPNRVVGRYIDKDKGRLWSRNGYEIRLINGKPAYCGIDGTVGKQEKQRQSHPFTSSCLHFGGSKDMIDVFGSESKVIRLEVLLCGTEPVKTLGKDILSCSESQLKTALDLYDESIDAITALPRLIKKQDESIKLKIATKKEEERKKEFREKQRLEDLKKQLSDEKKKPPVCDIF